MLLTKCTHTEASLSGAQRPYERQLSSTWAPTFLDILNILIDSTMCVYIYGHF